MCGIIGILGNEPAAPRVIEALKRLEYRGYDSAGVVTLDNGELYRARAPGKLFNLEATMKDVQTPGNTGIGHTRWATHGAPNETNAHPHVAGRVAIVHNGIIENFRELREEAEGKGRSFSTETDSETIAHLVEIELDAGNTPFEAVKTTIAKLRGAFGIAILIKGEEDLMFGARQGSPLIVGVGEDETFIGSDAFAVAPFTNKVIYLKEGEWCALTRHSVNVFNENGEQVPYKIDVVQGVADVVDKGQYRHYMLKEIFEQPESTARTIGAYVNAVDQTAQLPNEQELNFASFDRVYIIACGTAYYAGCVAKYWFEKYAKLPVETDIASEFRYREPALTKNSLAVFVTQSGETADTLAALRYCKEHGLATAAVVNVPTSTIARESDAILPTLAGAEVGVASTKAFTAQLCALASLAVIAGRARGELSKEDETHLTEQLLQIPGGITKTLAVEEATKKLAAPLSKATDVLYLGRGSMYPIAMEGALKLKEISYIHAEGYAAGELKHGPIALIDEKTPIVMIAPTDPLLEKTISNMQEVAARHGKVLLISDENGVKVGADTPEWSITSSSCDPFIAPILYSVPIQLLAYYIAVEKGTDVDQPRNLAKSVTVE
ncbi:glutamine--fructose-6-phosphate transaminase (isomerizing) [Hirschia maritima]|uniref:glutamine--fructose-6-phosphate transaminase (isomerizing) n=1 Tax=Hirschia maritima TaxID=1121961 RepID=UPI00036CD6A6|nr:glutamine--fructose-6-phosphate transaminase (isomerizing) [Hirschia maritima]